MIKLATNVSTSTIYKGIYSYWMTKAIAETHLLPLLSFGVKL